VDALYECIKFGCIFFLIHKNLVVTGNTICLSLVIDVLVMGEQIMPVWLLQFYGLQLHHIAPNNLVSVVGYMAWCEGYLGILPTVDLFQLFFCVWPNFEDDVFPWTCGTICFVSRRSKYYPFITPLDSTRGWRGSWFFQADKAAPSRTFGLHPFENVPVESRDSLKPVNDDSAIPYVKLLARRIAKLTYDGLKGIDTINC
jgi:hypothetical protein